MSTMLASLQHMHCAAARWKGALVAVKVIEHGKRDQSNAVDIARESSLATSVVHPNVVRMPGLL